MEWECTFDTPGEFVPYRILLFPPLLAVHCSCVTAQVHEQRREERIEQ
jgi:hypothetical protein